MMASRQTLLKHHESVLQHIVLDANLPLEVESLYVRHAELPFQRLRHSTDTYINIFHKKRWQDLTSISSYGMQISCHGKGRLELHGAFAPTEEALALGTAPSVLLNSCSVNSPENAFCWTPSLEGAYDFFFLVWEEEHAGALKIDKAQYITLADSKPRTIKIAIVTTTYQRREDIGRIVATYRQACENMPEISLSTHLFVINNEREDEDFLQQYAAPKISIITNEGNLGGSGGFAQGARLAVADGTFSHVLFMDDDALSSSESWFRTLRLAAYLRTELRTHPLSGAMFTREHPSHCHAMIEALDTRLYRLCLIGETNMEDAGSCLSSLAQAHIACTHLLQKEKDPNNTHVTAPYPYAAWWYCLFPIEIFQEFGYPAPYFYQKDDQEFGLRIRRTPLFLNGVCVWHPSFQNKTSALRSYLSLRNYALTCLDYTKKWRRLLLKRIFLGVTRSLAANDYERAALLLLSVEDFLSFPSIPREGEKLISRVQAKLRQYANKEVRTFLSPHRIAPQKLRHNLLPMLGVLLTLGGTLVPRFWRRGYTIAPFLQVGKRWASQWTAYSEEGCARCLQPLKAAHIVIKFLCCSTKLLFPIKYNERSECSSATI